MAARQLIEELLGQDPNLEFPPGAEAWSVEALQTFYDTAGAILPDEPDESVLPAPPAPMPAPPMPEPEPEPEPGLEIGGVWLPVRTPAVPALVPPMLSGGGAGVGWSQRSLEAMRWMMMQLTLGQDMLLLVDPGPRPRRLVTQLCAMLGREVEYVGISRDTTESDLKQRREIARSSVVYEPAPPLRAALFGRVLILDGVEKAERNVLPLLNNLLENREMALDDGRFLSAPAGPATATTAAASPSELRCDPHFIVVAIGLVNPIYAGNSLDPPLRSRFACHRLVADGVKATLAWPEAALRGGGGVDRRQDDLVRICDTLRARSLAGARLSGNDSLCESNRSSQLPWLAESAVVATGQLLRLLPQLSALSAVRLAYPYDSMALGTTTLHAVRSEVGRGLPEPGPSTYQVESCVKSTQAAAAAAGRCSATLKLCSETGESERGDDVVMELAAGGCRLPVGEERCTPAVLLQSQKVALGQLVAGHAAGSDTCLLGGRGGGKTFLVRRFASMLGYRTHSIFCHPELTSTELLQRRSTDLTGATIWRDSPIVTAACEGELAVIDGIDRLAPGTLTAALGPLLADRAVCLPDGTRLVSDTHWQTLLDAGNDLTGIRRVHQSFRVLACAESPTTRHRWLSDEVLSLFGCFVQLPHLTTTDYQHLLPNAAQPALQALLSFEAAMRAAATQDPVLRSAQPSIRQLLRASEQIAARPSDATSVLVRAAAPLLLAMPAAASATTQQLLHDAARNVGIVLPSDAASSGSGSEDSLTAGGGSKINADAARAVKVLQNQAISLRTAEMWGQQRDERSENSFLSTFVLKR